MTMEKQNFNSDIIMRSIDTRDQDLFLKLLPNSVYMQLPHGRRFQKAIDGITQEARNVIQKRSSGELPERPDLLSFMMEKDEQGNIPSHADLEADVNLFLFAGHETTSTTLTWALYHIASRPDLYARVQAEVNELGDLSNLDYDSSSKLKLLTNVVKETLRLNPPVAGFVREPTVDQKVGDLIFPSGVSILFLTHAMHRDPTLWNNPEEFDPDRFLPENSKGRHPFAWSPFAVGMRNWYVF